MTVTEPTTTELEDVAADARPDEASEVVAEELVDDELLVEEISIDGMCGVY